MDEWQKIVLTAVVGLVFAGIGAVLSAEWHKRRSSDRELFLLLRQAFDRPAFRGPYTFHSNQVAFQQAVGLLLKTISTGRYMDRAGKELAQLGGRYVGPLAVRNLLHREALEQARDGLQRIQGLANRASAGAATSAENLSLAIDTERDAVIKSLNSVWTDLKIAPMRLPTTFQSYQEVSDPGA